MTPHALTGGFADTPLQAARGFRAILTALSRPGTIVALTGATPPAPLSPAAGVAALVLLDATTPLHLAGAHDSPALRDWIAFHTGAPLVGAEAAMFAIGTWDALHPLDRFAIGTPDYPDRAATLIVETDRLEPSGARLTGPGIKGAAHLSLPETAPFRTNHARFPLGFDTFLTCGDRLAGLPRSTCVEAA
ncbi:phosphonate C-P lyase system protein PhnH [Rhodovulum tesquicola]|uniref:phosphonate C-P lyase system protein PhnH n=1 Tax=Rhodovulum tesquicola TaxID=540254 RepID=UPI0020968A0D|nr:phosphonate C-P lyase system protein PhnH [Rhodovulum tesquicola]MCO8146082.1 phosphonate C-P lyase system protein PhnH [Rhodovulum tesquicola]